MRQEETLQSRVKALIDAVKELKTAQPVTGDSWVPYRYAGSTSVPAVSKRFIVFTQDDTSRQAVVKMGQQLGFQIHSTGVRSQDGVHYFVFRNDSPSDPATFDYVLSTTMTGVVSILTTAPF